MPRPLRVAFARVAQESNALSPVRTTVEDFRAFHYAEGDHLLDICQPWRVEAKHFMRNAELSGFVKATKASSAVEPVPLFSAWAIPSGPLNAATFGYFKDKLADSLRRAGPLDGLFLSLHGAMNAEGVLDPEGELINCAREILGPEVRVGATYDLHGQLTETKAHLDAVAAYRTNPHRDHAKVGFKAGQQLISAIRGEVRPTTAWRTLPMLLGGGPTVDFLTPMRGIYREMNRLEEDPRILSTNLFMCHLWNNHPDLGWGVQVQTDGEPELAERVADEIADMAWAVRDQMPPEFLSPSEAIAKVREARLRRRLGTVCICDASDVVTAGSTGENTRLLKVLLTEGKGLKSYVPLRDPQAVERIWGTAPGAEVELVVGGTLDPDRNQGISVRGRVGASIDHKVAGRMIALQIDHVTLVLTEGLPAAVKPEFFHCLGLSVWKADIVVVKTLFPFRIFFLPYSRMSLYVRTEGITDFDAAYQLEFTDPMHPRDVVHDWRPADARRRGLSEAG